MSFVAIAMCSSHMSVIVTSVELTFLMENVLYQLHCLTLSHSLWSSGGADLTYATDYENIYT